MVEADQIPHRDCGVLILSLLLAGRVWGQHNRIFTDWIRVFLGIEAGDDQTQSVIQGRVDRWDDVIQVLIWLCASQSQVYPGALPPLA